MLPGSLLHVKDMLSGVGKMLFVGLGMVPIGFLVTASIIESDM